VLQPASIVERVHQGLNHLKASFSQSNFQATKQAGFKGQSLVETSLVMGLVGVVCIGTVATLGGNISNLMTEATSAGNGQNALVSTNQQLVNTNLGAPQSTTNGGFLDGTNNPNNGGTSGVRLEASDTTISTTSGGTDTQDVSPNSDTDLSDVTTGGSGGLTPNTSNAGSGSGQIVRPPTNTQTQQQFSPEYQAWRNNPNNAKTVAMIDSLSPDGQKIANSLFAETTSNGTGGGTMFLAALSNALTSSQDRSIYSNFVSSVSASVTE
jgi:hypothetical protein